MPAFILLGGVGALLWAMFGKPKRRDAVLTFGIIAVIGSILLFPSVVDEVLSGFQTASVSGTDVMMQPSVAPGTQCERQTDGTNTVNVVYRNAENSSLGYLAASVTAEVNGESQASGTTTSGATLSYLALNVPPCQSGKLYSLASTTEASTILDYNSFELTSNYEIKGAATNVVSVLARDSTLSARSSGNSSFGLSGDTYAVSGTGATDGNAYYRNTSFSSGSSLNFYLDYTVNGSNGVYGALVDGQPAGDGVVLSFDAVDSAVWSSNALTLASDTAGIVISKIICPQTISANRNAEACWKLRTIKTSDGEVRLRGTLKADLGDPQLSGDNPVLCMDENVYFRDDDGDVKYGTHTSSGTNNGLGGICLTFGVN